VLQASKSSDFTVKTIKIVSSSEPAPVDDETIIQQSGIPVGKIGLWQVDAAVVERRLLKHEWIKSVRVSKRYLHRIVVEVFYKEPVAHIRLANGKLAYVDLDGDVFGGVNLLTHRDLPLFLGFDSKNEKQIQDAVAWLKTWKQTEVAKKTEISSLNWDKDKGYSLTLSYAKNPVILGLENTKKMRSDELKEGLNGVVKSGAPLSVSSLISQKNTNSLAASSSHDGRTPSSRDSADASTLGEIEDPHSETAQKERFFRANVELGASLSDKEWSKKLSYLDHVLQVLTSENITTRRISIEQDKKVVVKIANDS